MLTRGRSGGTSQLSDDRATVPARRKAPMPSITWRVTRHVIDGIGAFLRAGTVARSSESCDVPPDRPLVSIHNLELSGFGHDRHVGPNSAFDQGLHTKKRVLLIDRARQEDVCGHARLL